MNNLSPTLTLACELIERPSVTPDDAGCQTLMRQRLEKIGFHCETLSFGSGESGDETVENLWAVRSGDGKNQGPILCFAGHTDVVPAGETDKWHSPPFIASEKEGMLYGRGVVDMKGAIAAMLVATRHIIQMNHSHPNNLNNPSFANSLRSDNSGCSFSQINMTYP